MLDNFRSFDVTDPFGRTWSVEFRWLQNAISIRHSDSVDVKYYLSAEGEQKREMVVSLMHPDLVTVAQNCNRDLTDAWVIRLAGLHLKEMISTWNDMERTIVTVSKDSLERYNLRLEESAKAEAERAVLHH